MHAHTHNTHTYENLQIRFVSISVNVGATYLLYVNQSSVNVEHYFKHCALMHTGVMHYKFNLHVLVECRLMNN